MELGSWGKNVGEEARKNFGTWLVEDFLEKYLSGDKVLDIGFAGYIDDVVPITPKAIGIGLDYPGYDGKTLPFPDNSQDTIFASHCLEHIEDYRTALSDWFRVLRVGGHLIIAVPHQYLYERNLRLPSRFNLDHRRFYTPASLMREIEESIDPLEYRVRELTDNDRGFDYTIEPEKHATGSYEILLVIERIARPGWAEQLTAPAKIRDISMGTFSSFPRPEAQSPTIEIRPTEPPKSIVAFKMDHLGDFILATPAMANLRRAFPDAFLTLVCGAWNTDEARQSGLFDEVLSFSLFERNAALNEVTPLHERIAELRGLLAGRRFDLAIDLRVDDDTRIVLKHVNARSRAGVGFTRDFPYLDIALPMLSPTLTGRTGESHFDASWFHSAVGHNQGYQITIPAGRYDSDANIIWGPYRSLHPSRYQCRLLMTDDQGEIPALMFDVVCEGGNRKLTAGRCEEIATTGIVIDLTEPVKDIEIRIWGRGEQTRAFTFRGCTFSKEGQAVGPHQSEIMAMLVALIEQRARYSPEEKLVA